MYNEAGITIGRVTASRLPSGNIKILVRNADMSLAQEMIVTKPESCDIRSALGILELALMGETCE